MILITDYVFGLPAREVSSFKEVEPAMREMWAQALEDDEVSYEQPSVDYLIAYFCVTVIPSERGCSCCDYLDWHKAQPK